MTVLSRPAPAPTARALHRQLARIAVIFSLATLFGNVVLVSFGLDASLRQLEIALGIVTPTIPIILAADLFGLNVQFRPIRACLVALETGRPTPEVAQQALIQALNLPLLTMVRILTYHAAAGFIPLTVLILLANRFLDFGIMPWQIISTWGTIFVSVVAHALVEHFLVLRAVQPVLPCFRAYAGDLPPEQARRIVSVSIHRRLLYISIWMTAIPPVVMSVAALARVNNLLAELGVADSEARLNSLLVWFVILIAMVTLVTITIARLMAAQMSRMVEGMASAMGRVERGDLDAHLEVTTTDEFAALYEGFNRMTQGLRERERLHDAFGRYVTPELAREVAQHGVRLGGETVQATVLFADIRGFTALSERMIASQVVDLLNRYFAAVEPVIEAEGGWINKFGGDSLLAVFGAPIMLADHTRCAVRAALGLRAALAQFNAQQQASGGPLLEIGMGIDTGEVVAGSVGSPNRMEYSVIGDTVNTASRVDALNKEWGTDLLITEAVYQAICEEMPAQAMPPTLVKGKSEPLQTYTLR